MICVLYIHETTIYQFIVIIKVYKHVHVEYKCSVVRIISSEASLTDKQPSLSSSTSFPTATASASPLSFTTASSSSTHATKVSSSSPLYVELTNGKMLVCDLLVSATGVNPNTALLHQLIVDGKVCVCVCICLTFSPVVLVLYKFYPFYQ